jgi:hypothetical protein
MTKAEKSEAAEAAGAALLAAGFEPVRDALLRRLIGRLGFGGRARFVKPGTALHVTVGKVTTCFYEVADGNTRHLVDVPNKRTRRIAFFANHTFGYRLVTAAEPAERAVAYPPHNEPPGGFGIGAPACEPARSEANLDARAVSQGNEWA